MAILNSKCSDIKGSNAKIKLREEDSFGEFSQTGYTEIPFNTFNVAYSRNEIDSNTIKAGRAPSEKALGNFEVAGDIVVPLEDNYSHYFLKNLLGNYSTETVDGRQEHTYTISNGCLGSLAFEKSFTDTSLNYLVKGVKLNSLSLELGGEGQVDATFSAIGKDEQMRKVSVDAIEDAIAADANINSTTITVVDGTKFKAGDVIIPRIQRGTLSANAIIGNSAIILNTGEGSGFEKGLLVELEGITYMVYSVSGDKIVLDRGVEKASVIGANVYLVENAYKVESVLVNELTLNQGLKNNVLIGDKIYSEPVAQTVVSTNFEHFNGEIFTNDSTIPLGYVQTLNFSFENQIEGQSFIISKGAYGKLLEGKVNITCELSMIFAVENAKMLEEAKVGKVFDLKITLTNRDGNVFEIFMPNGKITPTGPAIEGPNAITATVSFSPFGEGIYFKLINDKVYA